MKREFQDRFRSDNNRSNTYRGRPRYGQDYQGRSGYDLNYKGNYRNNMRGNQSMGDKIIIEMDLGEILEIKAMRETGVGHMIGKLEAIREVTIGALVTLYQHQVLD